ncbi:MAG TPA: VanZ family protein [Steroidobacteraceae bacterium]|nr:VanZ family protein [Steroidobacteraceae bacterium]
MKLSAPAFRRAWQGLILALVLAIAAGSLLPMPSLAVTAGVDKLEHFIGYFTLALLGAGIVTRERLWVVMARCFAFGAAIELLQGLLTSSRTADWADLAANGLGVAAAWAVAAGGRAGWARHVEAWIARRGAS